MTGNRLFVLISEENVKFFYNLNVYLTMQTKLGKQQKTIIRLLQDPTIHVPWKKRELSKKVAEELGIERNDSFYASYSRSLKQLVKRGIIEVIGDVVLYKNNS